ncbi:hypothetical protein MAHJHV58_31800 [Mycobacterium avium subsp. hominissuis]
MAAARRPVRARGARRHGVDPKKKGGPANPLVVGSWPGPVCCYWPSAAAGRCPEISW